MGAGAVRRVDVLSVLHESRVAAVQTAGGSTALLEAGLAEALRVSGARVRVAEIGEPSAGVLGEVARSLPDDAVLMVGTRDLDPGEERLLGRSDVVRLDAGEIPDGLAPAVRDLARRVESVSVHLDLDVVDSRIGKANGFASPGGLHAEDLELVLAAAGRTLPVRALTLASYDPRCDADRTVARVAVAAVVSLARKVLDEA